MKPMTRLQECEATIETFRELLRTQGESIAELSRRINLLEEGGRLAIVSKRELARALHEPPRASGDEVMRVVRKLIG